MFPKTKVSHGLNIMIWHWNFKIKSKRTKNANTMSNATETALSTTSRVSGIWFRLRPKGNVSDAKTLSCHENFREKFCNPHPWPVSFTVPVKWSGSNTNLTPRKSMMFLSVSIPYGESFPTRMDDTSGGHSAQRRNNKPCQTKNDSCY